MYMIIMHLQWNCDPLAPWCKYMYIQVMHVAMGLT